MASGAVKICLMYSNNKVAGVKMKQWGGYKGSLQN